jgi:hypothetical protein
MMLGSDQVTNAAHLVQLAGGVAESFDSRRGKDAITTQTLITKLRALTANGDENHYKASRTTYKGSSVLRIGWRLKCWKRGATL